MSLVLSDAIVLGIESINESVPRLCYQNIVTSGTVTATSEKAGFPDSNMSNSSTQFGWEASTTADQTITIDNSDRLEIDYIGIARHNLSQSGLEVRVRFEAVTVIDWQPVSDNQTILFLFTVATPDTIYIDIRGITNAAKVSVVYAGQSLQLERNIYVGHTPINYGRDRTVVTGVSQSNEYLGEITLSQSLSNSVSLSNLTPAWYRESLDPFFAQSPRKPCFFAWYPSKYKTEVGYVWVEGNPRPVNSRANGMMDMSWNFRGIS
jgi:hypothetical protein